MEEKKESGKIYTCKLCKKIFKQKCDYDYLWVFGLLDY